MGKNFFNQREIPVGTSQSGAIPVGIAILLLVTALLGVAAGYKAVQTPTKTTSKAAQFTCEQLAGGIAVPGTTYPNARCNETQPGSCTYGSWDFFNCQQSVCPTDPNKGIGVPYWCASDNKWHNMNWMGECTTKCQPPTQPPSQPTQPPPGGNPTQPPPAGEGCFYITVELNYTQEKDFDSWVTFHSKGTSNDIVHIQLWRDNAHMAGYNKWPMGGPPFTYWPGGNGTGGRIPVGTSVTFKGEVDNCPGTVQNSVTCTTSANGTFSGNGCVPRGGGGGTTPPPTTTPKPGATNTPVPVAATSTPTPIPDCNVVGAKCCDGYQCKNPFYLECKYNISKSGYYCSNKPPPTPPPGESCGYLTKPCCTTGLACRDGTICSDTNTPEMGTCTAPPIVPTSTPTPTVPVVNCGLENQVCCLEYSCKMNHLSCQSVVGKGWMCKRKAVTPPPGTSCGYEGFECCKESTCPGGDGSTCQSDNFCRYIPLSSSQPNIIQRAAETVKQIFTGSSSTPAAQPENQPTSLKGTAKINNSTQTPVAETFVTLHNDKNDQNGQTFKRVDQNGAYSFDGLTPGKTYIVKSWAKTAEGNWYQNEPCSFTKSDYDCTVKPGQTRNLSVNIGLQGLRYTLEQSQKTSKTVMDKIQRLPVVGPFIQMFIISAF